ncbi:MAG TPA: gluconate 2-dehydrogenase subunit 3 family protein [Chitinophagaceae bacterium]|nr:gluconate 2-dehydrogenase subunit 3 family protein [Chitinophagaceae bacterium]
MERRSAIRNLVVITGGFMLLPSCKNTPGKASVGLKNFKINASQENLLAEIASTIIPATNIAGAKEVGAHLFVLKMVDDMYEKEVQQNFITGLDYLEADAKRQFDQSFANCNADQKQKVLLDIESKKGYSKEVFDFYAIMKQRTIEGYLNSKYVMTNIIKYEFIPSHKYDGYYPVKNL